jgi:hypothetical protein
MAVNLAAHQFQLPVPGLTVVTPQMWTPTPAFRDQTATAPTKKIGVVIHYPGNVSNDPKIHDVVASVRAGQLSYRADPNRGYDYGYNYVVDQTGRTAVVRGLYKSAANGTTDGNNWYLAIQIAVDPDEGLNGFNVLAVQRIIYHLRTVEGYGLAILGHRNIKGTACPGEQIYQWLKAGGFEPRPEEWPENRFNPWAGRYGTWPTKPKAILHGGEGPTNLDVSYMQGVLINEFGQVITDPDGTYGWSTVSAVVNMKTWFNATRPQTMAPMNPGVGTIDLYEWNYLDYVALSP